MYIRTKDGVYEVEGNKFYDALKRKHYITTKGLAIKEDDIINQSENLEELCDEFVIEYIASDVLFQVRYAEFQWAEEEFESDKKETLYGAIRVAGKGLIYVAKLVDGKLVLIWKQDTLKENIEVDWKKA